MGVRSVAEVVNDIATGAWGTGFAKGLSSSSQEIGETLVSTSEKGAASVLIHRLKQNGAKFDEDKLTDLLHSKDIGFEDRQTVFDKIDDSISEETKDATYAASQKAMYHYKKGGAKLEKYMESGATPDAAAAYFGREGRGVGMGRQALGYFANEEHGGQRMATAAGGAVAAGITMRTLQGGTMGATPNGQKNIAGLPFV